MASIKKFYIFLMRLIKAVCLFQVKRYLHYFYDELKDLLVLVYKFSTQAWRLQRLKSKLHHQDTAGHLPHQEGREPQVRFQGARQGERGNDQALGPRPDRRDEDEGPERQRHRGGDEDDEGSAISMVASHLISKEPPL